MEHSEEKYRIPRHRPFSVSGHGTRDTDTTLVICNFECYAVCAMRFIISEVKGGGTHG